MKAGARTQSKEGAREERNTIADIDQWFQFLMLSLWRFSFHLDIQGASYSNVQVMFKRVPQKLKGKFYRTAIRPAMLYGAECWPTKRRHVQQLSVAEMRMLRWFCGHTRRDKVRNEVIRNRVGVAPIEEKLTQHRLRWFGHVQRRPPEAPVRNGVLERVDNVKRGRGRPKLTWDESVKRDLKDWNISKEIALDRSAWRLAINVPEPWTYFFGFHL